MAPKKTKTWKDNYQSLMDNHGICFEGPKQPADWPVRHKHLFEVIRDIWAVRYAGYKKSKKLSKKAVRERRRTSAEISETAHCLRHGRINEETWRRLEDGLMRVFERRAVWNELYRIEDEAMPRDDDESVKLKRKRERRKACTCDQESGSLIAELEDIDEAQPIIFTVYKSTPITHEPTDALEDTDIPMEPDRTIGLSVSPRMKHALRQSSSKLHHCPMRGTTNGLYPFLLIEAKRGVDAPGFAAIEAQTAFPLRRLLMLQHDLQRESKIAFDPLVWFFAYQGEEWRLYAGTLEENIVHVYDLWHGSMESLDSSLQLLQIVDYLWTWARDIYRPQIRRCLYALAPAIREISPSTDSGLSRSQSVLTELNLRPSVLPQVDTVMKDDQPIDIVASRRNHPSVPDSRFHLFQYELDWPDKERSNFTQTRVRHSDLVNFSFRAFHCPTHDHALQQSQLRAGHGTSTGHLKFLLERRLLVALRPRQISDLERIWTGRDTNTADVLTTAALWGTRKVVHFHYRTFFRREDWQIVRELDCFVWDPAVLEQNNATELREAVNTISSMTEESNHYATLVEMLSTARRISGKSSVTSALSGRPLILSCIPVTEQGSSTIRWAEPCRNYIESLGNPAWRSSWPPQLCYKSAQIVALEQRMSQGGGVEEFILDDKEMGLQGGIMVKKPRSWPAECPRFCLFVLLDIAANERERLAELLAKVIKQREFYGPMYESADLSINAEERSLLRNWLRSFGS